MAKSKFPKEPKPPRRRELTESEKETWDQMADGAKPIPGKREKAAKPAPKSLKHVKLRSSVPTAPQVKRENMPSIGSYANIDHRTADKFRKGSNPIDATLDLHFMTRDEAHKALEKFIHRCHRQEKRFLLIITGKGREGQEGVLKQAVRGWLTGDDLAPFILAIDQAQQKDGGSGAYYVLLRRQR